MQKIIATNIAIFKKGSDSGLSCGNRKVTPPYMRVRIRRFRDLGPRGPEVRVAVRQWWLRRFQVPFGLHPIRPRQAQPKLIGWRMAHS